VTYDGGFYTALMLIFIVCVIGLGIAMIGRFRENRKEKKRNDAKRS
jgi:hypothetical protein